MSDPEYYQLQDLPKKFQEEKVCANLWLYSVALGCCLKGDRDIQFFGSGVLVVKDGHYGILTAHHCLHDKFSDFQNGSFGKCKLAIAYQRAYTVLEPEILFEHQLGIPIKNTERPDDPGAPDLTFIEIYDCTKLKTLKSVNSFWCLDKNPYNVIPAFGRIEMPFCVNGYPGNDYKETREGNTLRKTLKHVSYFYVHGCDSFSEDNGWDYVKAEDKKNAGLSSFEGMSGGAVWGLRIKKHPDNEFELLQPCLIGINIWQSETVGGDDITVHAHFIRSIYDVAWRNIQWRSPGIILPPIPK